MSHHRCQHKAWVKRGKVGGCASFQIIDVDVSAYIELIRTYNFENKDELRREEQIEMRKVTCVNKYAAILDAQELAAYAANYYTEHRDYRNERIECSCGKTYTRANLPRHTRSKFHQRHIAQQQAAAVE